MMISILTPRQRKEFRKVGEKKRIVIDEKAITGGM